MLLSDSPARLYRLAHACVGRLYRGLRWTLSSFHRSHHRWVKDHGDSTLRLNYPLGPQSVVFDIGGYKGEWAKPIVDRYGAKVLVFEPIKAYADIATKILAPYPSVTVYPFALGTQNTTATISLDHDASSLHKQGMRTDGETIQIHDIVEFMTQHKIDRIDLAKINIEGVEYDLLEHLITHGLINRFDRLQVQFHLFVPHARKRYQDLAKRLEATHRLTWRYPFVWENWEKRDAL